MARPRKTSDELKASGARRGRIEARLKDEAEALARTQPKKIVAPPVFAPRPIFLKYFLERSAKLEDTFRDRCIPGQTVMLEFGNMPFNWRTDHPLTEAKELAEGVISESRNGPYATGLAKKFLHDLENGHTRNIFADPEAFDVLPFLHTFQNDPGWMLTAWEIFATANFMGWRHSDGSFVSEDTELVHLDNVSILAIDRASEAIAATA